MTQTALTVRYASSAVQLGNCLGFTLERDRFTPYTKLTGQWYCPKTMRLALGVSFILMLDGEIVHYGYPISARITENGGRTLLKLTSYGYSAQLMQNQCADGLVSDVNLDGLVRASGITVRNVAYQTGTPTVNYVNYYNGTSLWDGIVKYSLRAGGKYPYLSGYNLIRITPPEQPAVINISRAETLSRENLSDLSRAYSRITMRPIDGEGDGYTITNTATARLNIVRCREIPFDREWIMDPEEGLKAKLDYSMRKMNSDFFAVKGYKRADLMDRLAYDSPAVSGDICGITVSASPEEGFKTVFRCDHDNYSG